MYLSERINEQSYKDIQQLYALSFNHHEELKFIQNKYDTSVFGLRDVGMIAKSEGGKNAAYYGVFPILLDVNGNDFLVAQSGDTMTAPEHRKQGLFVRLAQETYSLCRELGIQFVFGFPNENSYPGFKKNLNWVFHGCMYQFRQNVLTIPVCELAAKFPFLKSLYRKFVSQRIRKYEIKPCNEVMAIFQTQGDSYEIKKDHRFFDYKLKGENVHLIQIDGFTLLIKAKTHLHIGVVGFIQIIEVARLINTVRKLARRLGCKTLIFKLSANHWLFDALKELIKPTESHPIGFYQINQAVDLSKIQFTAADYDTF